MSTLKIKRENGKIFCPLADSWHIETPEEKVRQEYIKILVENYGYSLDQMAQEIKVNNSQRGQGKARADIVIWKSKQDKIESKAAFIVVECKAENVRIREEDYFRYIKISSLITDPVTHTLILFIFCTHFIWSADLSCSVTPSFSAYSFTSREKRACASSSTSARWECSLPEVSRL